MEVWKKLQSLDGPIVRGYDHMTTGKSSELPSDFCHMGDLYPSSDSRFEGNFDYYPWIKEGGELIKRIIEKNGKQYVAIAKHTLCSEGGKGVPSRRYHETHAIFIPANEWSIAVIPQLCDVLEAEGVTEINLALPNVEFKTDLLDKPLLDGWFNDYVKEMISNVVSGRAVTFQDWNVTEKDFLQKLFYCLICLPENIARQISFGAGLSAKEEGEVRIAQTVRGRGLRKIGGQWKDSNPEDLAFGKKYIDVLNEIISNCSTPRQVLEAVTKIPLDIRIEIEQRFKKK